MNGTTLAYAALAVVVLVLLFWRLIALMQSLLAPHQGPGTVQRWRLN